MNAAGAQGLSVISGGLMEKTIVTDIISRQWYVSTTDSLKGVYRKGQNKVKLDSFKVY